MALRQTRRDAASTLEPYFRNSSSRAFGAPMAHENWRKRQSKLSGSESGSVSGSAFQDFDPDTDPDPDGFWFGLFSEQIF
jgi:hypothetical protein